MVRKRSRRYSSEDNDSDSDVDLSEESISEPAPKKYSLRERKAAPLLPPDFDFFGLDEEDPDDNNSEDDEEYDYNEYNIQTEPDIIEQPAAAPSSPGLIDFEDVIRADILVNTKKGRYNNLSDDTEKDTNSEAKNGNSDKASEEISEKELENKSSDSCDVLELSDNNVNGKTVEDKQEQSLEENKSSSSPKGEEIAIISIPVEEEDDDDDVIVLEPKHEIIVLDDD